MYKTVRMKATSIVFLLAIAFGMAACSKPAAKCDAQGKATVRDNTGTVRIYENELFSIVFPVGWVCDSSGWKGLDSMQNEVDIYDPNGNVVWFHIVKAYFPIQWKNVEEAAEMPKTMRAFDQKATLLQEVDSAKIDGYPTKVLLFANIVDNDTIIQKQFVTYLQESHIVVYFNENFYVQDWDEAQKFGDQIIGTIKLKKVRNPLEK